MVENHDNFFQEIEEDVKLDKLEKMWKEYQSHIVAGVVGIAILIGGGLYWNNWRHEKQAEISQTYVDGINLISKGQKDEGYAKLDSIKDEKGYGAMAMLVKASDLAKDPKTLPEALKIFTEIAENRSYDKKFNMLAGLMRTLNQLDTVDVETVRANLEILKDPNNPWQALATELEAALEYKAGNKEKAKELYQQLAEDARASQTMRVRALAVLTELR